MSTTLLKITARAKRIRKSFPNKKWTDCIKQASRELKSSPAKKAVGKTAVKKSARKKPAKKRAVSKTVKYRQTGSSNKKADRERTALAPGKRLSRSRVVYYERRKNRSDKPGQLSGVSDATLKKALRDRLLDKLGKEHVKKDVATLKREKAKHQKQITAIKAELRKLK